MPNIELELTYLAASIPEAIKHSTPKRLSDVYIPENPDVHAKLRIRQKGDSYIMTKKIPISAGDASKQNEFDIPLDEAEFKELIKVSNRRITKDRYEIELAGRIAEVDVFQESLKGLIVIDFEFEKEEEQKNFIPPIECLANVTQENFIAGGNLAGLGYSDIEGHLDRYNYVRLM